MTLKQKKAINNLRDAWKFYEQCQREKDTGADGALRDAKDWVNSAVQELLDCTVYYETRND